MLKLLYEAIEIKPGPLWPVIIFRTCPKMLLSLIVQVLLLALAAAAERKKSSSKHSKKSHSQEFALSNKDLHELLREHNVENPGSYMFSYVSRTGHPSLYRSDAKNLGSFSNMDELIAIIKTL